MKKIKHILQYIVCLPMMACLWSCDGDEPKPGPDPKPNPDDEVQRTVLVYMVTANNLGGANFDKLDIDEMRVAARKGELNDNRWIVYHSTYSNSKLYELVDTGMVMLKEYPSATSVSIERMQEVITDSRSFAPAKGYGMVFWSHASGWLEDGIDEEAEADKKPLSFGEDNSYGGRKKMSLTSLRKAIKEFGFEYLYFDCCLMGGVEVAYELRDCANYIVASPTEIPAKGMPYDHNLKELCDGSREALIQAAANTFNFYNEDPDPYNRSATISVIDTRHMAELASATAAIYDLAKMPHPLDIVTNYYGSERSKQAYYLDFGEYVHALCDSFGIDASLRNAFDEAMSKVLVYKNSTGGMWFRYDKYEYTIYNYSGLSTRVFNNPADIDVKGYDRLQWTSDVVKHHPEFK